MSILCCLFAFPGCATTWLASGSGEPVPAMSQLLSLLQKSFIGVRSFHVTMQVQNPGPAMPGRVQIRSASGDIVIPNKVQAQAVVMLSGQAVTINLVSIDKTQFITDPITGQWRASQGILNPRALTNPNTGIISIVSRMQVSSSPTADNIDGVPCWRVNGQIPARYIAFLGSEFPDDTPLQVSACLDKKSALPSQISLAGRAVAGDTSQTVRTFVLSKYNENVRISVPQ